MRQNASILYLRHLWSAWAPAGLPSGGRSGLSASCTLRGAFRLAGDLGAAGYPLLNGSKLFYLYSFSVPSCFKLSFFGVASMCHYSYFLILNKYKGFNVTLCFSEATISQPLKKKNTDKCLALLKQTFRKCCGRYKAINYKKTVAKTFCHFSKIFPSCLPGHLMCPWAKPHGDPSCRVRHRSGCCFLRS